jgi:pimeloyl-ACP methyl ester carboxylesterase
VEYGVTDSYGSTVEEGNASLKPIDHEVVITGLDRCRTYHFRVKSVGDDGEESVGPDDTFFTTGCDVVYPGVDASCDDTNPNHFIRVRTEDDVVRVRNLIINEIWREKSISGRLPNKVEKGITDFVYLDGVDKRNLDRVDKYTVESEQGYMSVVFHLHPITSNNRLLAYHHGHRDSLVYDGGQETVDFFLSHGFSVLVFYMPGFGPNDGPTGNCHDCMRKLESSSFNPMKIFVEPIAMALNYMDKYYSYKDFSMVGVSGGGWAATLYSAIDPRIRKSFSVAGTMPRYLLYRPCGEGRRIGDYEQGGNDDDWPDRLYDNVSSFLDLYILSSVGEGRKHMQIYNYNDSCCFSGNRGYIFEETVANVVAGFWGGSFDVVVDDTHSGHGVSSWQLKDVMLLELGRVYNGEPRY